MVKAPFLDKSGSLDLDEAVFGRAFNQTVVHEVVRAEQNARRQGTAATRTRGMVSGGGVKPWRQKGTGRARAGSIRSPLWIGGGTVFGPQPRSHTVKVNRKVRKSALCAALSLHAARNSLAIVDGETYQTPSTKKAAQALNNWAKQSALVVVTPEEKNIGKSFRNLARVKVTSVEAVGVVDLVSAAWLVLSQAAADTLTKQIKGVKEKAST
jgi:large subunit ribosomal protein L4